MKFIPGSGFPEMTEQTGSGPDYPPITDYYITHADLRQAFPNNNQNLHKPARPAWRQPAVFLRANTEYLSRRGYLNVIPGDPP